MCLGNYIFIPSTSFTLIGRYTSTSRGLDSLNTCLLRMRIVLQLFGLYN